MPALHKSHFQVICSGVFSPKYAWLDFFFFFLWGFEAKRLSKYAHASPRREVAQWVVQLRYRNRTPKCRRRARIRLLNPRNSRTPQFCCLDLCEGFTTHLTTAQPTAFSTVLQEPAYTQEKKASLSRGSGQEMQHTNLRGKGWRAAGGTFWGM